MMLRQSAHTSAAQMVSSPVRRWVVFRHALLFVLGFSFVFVIGWGGAATVFGQLFRDYKPLLGQIGGVIIILFGVSTLGLVRIPWLNYDLHLQWQPSSSSGQMTSALMGVFFAAGWTPCIGTTLGAILTLGISQDTSGQAMILSSGYALGLGVPFLVIGLGIERMSRLLRRSRRHMRKFQLVSGSLLILIGVLMISNRMIWVAIWTQRNNLYLDLPFGGATAPTYLIAMLAGLVSFLSPCVLPLVPAYVGYLSGHASGIHQT